MHKRVKKYETGASIGSIIDLNMLNQINAGLGIRNYNNFMTNSQNLVNSDKNDIKSSSLQSNPMPSFSSSFSSANGLFSKNTVNSVNNWQNKTFKGSFGVNNLNSKFGGGFNGRSTYRRSQQSSCRR